MEEKLWTNKTTQLKTDRECFNKIKRIFPFVIHDQRIRNNQTTKLEWDILEKDKSSPSTVIDS